MRCLVGGGDGKGSGDRSVNEAPMLCLDAGGLTEAGVRRRATRALGNAMAGIGDLEVTMNIMGGGN